MAKKDYKYYKLEDFLTDDEFKRWVFNRDKQLDLFWEKWIDAHPEQKPTVQKAREILLRLKFRQYKVDGAQQERVLEQVLKGHKSHRAKKADAGPVRPGFRIPVRWWIRVAATLFLIALLTFLGRMSEEGKQSKQVVEAVKTVTRAIPRGQKLSMMLPDGSRVYLNAESTITFPEKFEGESRTVELTGEAYFDVVKNEHKPFIVRTGQVATVVLGTSFNINSFPEQNAISVSLVSGKVSVLPRSDFQHNTDEVILAEGEKVTINKTSSVAVKSFFDATAEVGWKDGLLVFEGDDYRQVMTRLERWYGVTFVAQNKPAGSWEIKGRFDNLSLEEVLDNLKYTHQVDYRIEDKTVYLNFEER